VQNVRETRIKNKANMLVIERIENLTPFTARLHKVRRSEDSELMAHHRTVPGSVFSAMSFTEISPESMRWMMRMRVVRRRLERTPTVRTGHPSKYRHFYF
jgi:hypothetical protein